MRKHGFRALSLTLGMIVCGCAKPPPPRVVAAPEPAHEAVEPPPSAEGEIGGLPEEAMNRALSSLDKDVVSCIEKRSNDIESLGGHMLLAVRVARDGSTKWAFLRESTIGDRETERCVINLAVAKTWPKPVGGEGLAQKAFDVDPQKAPFALEEKRVHRVLDEARREGARCRNGVKGRFLATAYLRGNGKVLAAGAAPPHENSEQAVDCIVEALLKMQFGKLGGKMSKLTFEL